MTKFTELRLKLCCVGTTLLTVFLITSAVLILLHAALIPVWLRNHWAVFAVSAALSVLLESTVFWVGIVCVYIASVQLGIKWRILGAVFGLVPIANLILLGKILRIVNDEIAFETKNSLSTLRGGASGCARPNIRFCWYTACSFGTRGISITGGASRTS